MTLKMVAVLAAVCASALTFSESDTFARSGAGGRGIGAAPFVRPGVPLAHRPPFLHHHRRGFVGGLWPVDGFYGGAPYSEPLAASVPLTNDVNYNYTYKQDVPWDWAHR